MAVRYEFITMVGTGRTDASSHRPGDVIDADEFLLHMREPDRTTAIERLLSLNAIRELPPEPGA